MKKENLEGLKEEKGCELGLDGLPRRIEVMVWETVEVMMEAKTVHDTWRKTCVARAYNIIDSSPPYTGFPGLWMPQSSTPSLRLKPQVSSLIPRLTLQSTPKSSPPTTSPRLIHNPF